MLFGEAIFAASDQGDSFEVWQVQGQGWQPTAVTALLQTHDGYIWLGTYHGLARYDGIRFTIFDAGNQPGLVNGRITSLFEDANGVLWLGHETGQLSRYQSGNFAPVNLKTNWPGGAVEAISADELGDLWILNDAGYLFRVRDGKLVLVPGGASPARKATLTRSTNGRLWLACNGVISQLQHEQLEPFAFPDQHDGDFYARSSPAKDGGLWVVVNQRIRKWRDGRWITPPESSPRAPDVTSSLLETRSGGLLAGTLNDGLYYYSPQGAALHFSRSNHLSHAWVRSLGEDQEGNIWLGTDGGFDTLRPRKVTMLSPPDEWQGFKVTSFALLRDGSAWIGTEGAGMYRYVNDGWTHFGREQGMPGSFVWSILELNPDALFIGTWDGGLAVKCGDRFEFTGELRKITEPVLSMYRGKDGELWLGTRNGLHRYENGKLTFSAGPEKLTLPDVRAITESPDGVVWFGMCGGGLGKLKDGKLTQITKKDGLASDFTECLCADEDGTLWVGSSDNGLTRVKDGRFATISTAQGLSSRVLTHIVDDGSGNLWLGSQSGILRASKGDLQRCADGHAKTVPFLSFGKEEGLAPPAVCSGGFQPGACKGPDGRLWFPTAKGLAIVDPANVATNTYPPPVAIEEFKVDEKPFDFHQQHGAGKNENRPLQISPGKRSFEVAYTGLSFVAPEKVRFRYRLQGLEQEWVDAGTRRSAPYSYLRPGPYVFKVIACNNDGFWNEQGASLAFVVLPYFWQTWWFDTASWLGGAGVVGAGVLAVTRRRLRQKLAQLERQRALERERARIARDIHDDLGASLTRITMLSQSVRGEVAGQTQAAADVDQIYRTARELTRAMDEIVWAVNPKHDTLDSLVTYLGRFAQHFLSAGSIRCRLEVPEHLPSWALTAEVRHNVFLALKEALNNALKHAAATEVKIAFTLSAEGFSLLVWDNGRGFDWQAVQSRAGASGDSLRFANGNGVANMQRRLEEIGGRCEWLTAPGEGTRVTLFVPVKGVASSKKRTIQI